MRRKFVLSLGFAAVLSGSAAAQAPFATERPPPAAPLGPVSPTAPPALPPGVRPLGGAYVPPVGGVPPAMQPGGLPGITPVAAVVTPTALPPPVDVEIRSALGVNHPWTVKPEHGAYFICVKSYSRPARPEPGDNGPSARELAEALAKDIRELYLVQTFLYEYVSEERKAEMASIAAARERSKIFAGQLEKYKQEAQLKGGFFLEPDTRVRFKTVKYNDQVAVFVGGFKSDEDARKAITKVRTWLPPKDKILMDGAAIIHTGKDGKQLLEQGHMNPYLTAYVVPNPMIPRAGVNVVGEAPLDPFVVKLNDGRPYNLLKATKGWTLAVKSFSSPVEIVGRGDGNVMRKPNTDKGADVLKASAIQAEELAKALREMRGPKGEPLNLEAFVLHNRGSSMVSIGQFDGPNDPALVQTKQLLAKIEMRVTEDKAGLRPLPNAGSVFGNMVPVPIPKS